MNKLFFLLSVIIVVILLFVIVIFPRYREVQSTRAELETLQGTLETIDSLETSRSLLERQKATISQRDLARLEEMVPGAPDNIRLIIQLDELAKKNGLTTLREITYDTDVSALPPGQEQDTQMLPYQTYSMSFTTTGQYQQFLTFLEQVEKNLRIVGIKSIEISNREVAATRTAPAVASSQEYQVQLEAYWVRE